MRKDPNGIRGKKAQDFIERRGYEANPERLVLQRKAGEKIYTLPPCSGHLSFGLNVETTCPNFLSIDNTDSNGNNHIKH